MKLRDIMTSPVLTVTRGETASDAFARMKDASVRHAVVLSGDQVLGVISERDLGGPHGGAARKGRYVADVMRDDPFLARPDLGLAEAVRLMREQHIGCLPVVERDRLVGIVTRSDLLAALAHQRRDRSPIVRAVETPPRPPHFVSPNRDKWP